MKLLKFVESGALVACLDNRDAGSKTTYGT